MEISEESGAERGDEYDYENERVMRLVNRANKIDPRTGITPQIELGSGPAHPDDFKKLGHAAGLAGAELMQEMIQNKGGKK